jgi:Ala-tRNA(Pro) deacylase
MTVATIERKLRDEHVVYDLIRHEQTESAAAEAAATGLPEVEVGKTVVLAGAHGFVRAVLPASARLDLHKLRGVVGCGSAVRLATEVELLTAYPMFELGAVPPFGGARRRYHRSLTVSSHSARRLSSRAAPTTSRCGCGCAI